MLGNILGSIRVGDGADERVPVPVFAAGERGQVVLGERGLVHRAFLFLLLGCSCCCNPGPRRERGVQGAGPFAGTRNAEKWRAPRERRAPRPDVFLRYGWKGLAPRRGAAPLRPRTSARIKRVRDRYP